MEKPIQFIKSIINCDHCEYEQEINRDDVAEWLNVKCPECGNILIDEDDLKIAALTTMTVDLVNAVVGDVDGADAERRHIKIDSHLIKQIFD